MICISLMITDVEHLFMCLLTIYRCVLWKNVYLGLLPILKKNSCSFFLLLSSGCISPRQTQILSNRTQCGQHRCVQASCSCCLLSSDPVSPWGPHPGSAPRAQSGLLSSSTLHSLSGIWQDGKTFIPQDVSQSGFIQCLLVTRPGACIFCRNSMDVASLVCIPQGGT